MTDPDTRTEFRILVRNIHTGVYHIDKVKVYSTRYADALRRMDTERFRPDDYEPVAIGYGADVLFKVEKQYDRTEDHWM